MKTGKDWDVRKRRKKRVKIKSINQKVLSLKSENFDFFSNGSNRYYVSIFTKSADILEPAAERVIK